MCSASRPKGTSQGEAVITQVVRNTFRRGGTHRSKNEKSTSYEVLFSFLVAGMGFEPHDLRVMSPTSYQTALPRDIQFRRGCRTPGSNRYDTFVSRDFKSRASANSATPARAPAWGIPLLPDYYTTLPRRCQVVFEISFRKILEANPSGFQSESATGISQKYGPSPGSCVRTNVHFGFSAGMR